MAQSFPQLLQQVKQTIREVQPEQVRARQGGRAQSPVLLSAVIVNHVNTALHSGKSHA